MERQTIDITVRGFEAQAGVPMHCSMVLGHVGLNACMSKQKQIVALRGWHFDQEDKSKLNLDSTLRDMNTVIATEPIFDHDFESMSIFLSNPWATLVPDRLYDADAGDDSYLQLLLRDTSSMQVSTNALAAYECKLVYGIEKRILKLLLSKFPNAKFSHIAHPLLLAWKNQVQDRGPMCFINFSNYMAQIAVFLRGELQFFNSFSFTSPADFLYFALLPFNQLKLDPLKVPLVLSGEIIEYSALHKILMRYVRNISFADTNKGRDFPTELQALPNHFHFDLYSSL